MSRAHFRHVIWTESNGPKSNDNILGLVRGYFSTKYNIFFLKKALKNYHFLHVKLRNSPYENLNPY